MLAAGSLDRRITIEQSIPTRSTTGEVTRSWVPLAVVYASLTLPSARQAMSSQQMQSEVDAVFTIRHREDVTPHEARRVLFHGKRYRIKGVRELGRKVGLQLDCTARAE